MQGPITTGEWPIAAIGNYKQAIEDLKIASKLGNKASQDFLKKHGIDW